MAALEVPSTRVAAATTLLDRGWGKVKQPIDQNASETTVLHLLAAKLVSAQLVPQLEVSRAPAREATIVSLDAPPPTE